MAEIGDILIVGGGIAGLTLAAGLVRQGFRAELVERDPEWRALGAGIAIQPNGLRVLRELDLDVAVQTAGAVVHRWLFVGKDGEVLSETDLEAIWGDAGLLIGIARTALQRVLLESTSQVPCRLGISLSSVTEHDDAVTVTFTDGSVGTYGLVVGADGIHSAVRRFVAGRTLTPSYAGHMAWRSLTPLELPGSPSIQFWLGDECFFGLCPVGDGYTYGFGPRTKTAGTFRSRAAGNPSWHALLTLARR